MLGPRIIGHVKTATGSFTVGYLVMAAALFVGGLLVLNVKERIHRETD
jgi:MFS-type transporter involved in bile tolerance (Atg22 family)